MDPEEVARQAMLRGTEQVVAPAPASPTPVADTEPKEKWWIKVKPFVYTPWFRYMIVFVVTSILLLIISPPFVQVRRKNQSALEKAPTSYKRIMIVAAVTTGVVAVSPLIYTHRDKIVSAASVVKNWF